MNLDKMKTHKDTRGPPRRPLGFKIPMIQSRIYKGKISTIPIVPGKFKTRGEGCLVQEAREKMRTDFGAANQPGKFDEDSKFTSATRTGQDWILPRQEPKNLDSNCADIVARPIVLGKFETRGGVCSVQESRARYRIKTLAREIPFIHSRMYKEMKSTIPIVPGKFKTRGGGCLVQEAREKMRTDFGAANQPGKFDEDNKFTSETRTGQDWILPRQEPKNLDSNCANIVARPIVLGKFKTRGGGCLVQESREKAMYKMKTHKDTRGPPRDLSYKCPMIRSRIYKEKKSTIPIVPGKFKTRGVGCLVQESRAQARENMKTDFGAANQPGKFDSRRRG